MSLTIVKEVTENTARLIVIEAETRDELDNDSVRRNVAELVGQKLGYLDPSVEATSNPYPVNKDGDQEVEAPMAYTGDLFKDAKNVVYRREFRVRRGI